MQHLFRARKQPAEEFGRHRASQAKQQGKHLDRPAGRDAEKLAKVATALERGLSVDEIVTLTGISPASVKHYRQDILL